MGFRVYEGSKGVCPTIPEPSKANLRAPIARSVVYWGPNYGNYHRVYGLGFRALGFRI